MRLPNLVIMGAPKCGTTSLVHWLREHPQIYFPVVKEPHYFNFDDTHRNVVSWRGYQKLFTPATEAHRVVGEASVWYLSSRAAARVILERCPDARFVVMLRNPLEMAPALHQQNLYGMSEDVEDFGAAWALQEARRRSQRIPKGCRDARHLQYGQACRLGDQLRRLLDQVDATRVQTIFLHELAADPAALYGRLLAFLGVVDDGRTDFAARNPAKAYRSRAVGRCIKIAARAKRSLGIARSLGIDRAATRPMPRAPLTAALQEDLWRFFADDVETLGALTGRDLSIWAPPASSATASGAAGGTKR